MSLRQPRILAAALAVLLFAVISSRAMADFQTDDFHTFGQFNWDSSTVAMSLLSDNYGPVYAPLGGLLEVGILGPSGHLMTFTSAAFVLQYLPATGPPGPLTSDLINPTSSPSGQFGGDAVALKLNVDFSDAGVLTGLPGIHFGDLELCNFTDLPALNGLTVRDLLEDVNIMIGGGTATYTIAQLDPVVFDLNISFVNGIPSEFAQDHLMIVPEPSGAAAAMLSLMMLARRRRRTGSTAA